MNDLRRIYTRFLARLFLGNSAVQRQVAVRASFHPTATVRIEGINVAGELTVENHLTEAEHHTHHTRPEELKN